MRSNFASTYHHTWRTVNMYINTVSLPIDGVTTISWRELSSQKTNPNSRIRNLVTNMSSFEVYVSKDLSKFRKPTPNILLGFNPNYIDLDGRRRHTSDLDDCTEDLFIRFDKTSQSDAANSTHYLLVDYADTGLHYYVSEGSDFAKAIYISNATMDTLGLSYDDVFLAFNQYKKDLNIDGFYDYLLSKIAV